MLNDMIAALERWKAEHTALPPKEYRLHPDDYAELRRSCLTRLTSYPNEDALPPSFSGVPLVIDETAPRLPRKPKEPS